MHPAPTRSLPGPSSPPTPPAIRTDRLDLRPLEPGDRAPYLALVAQNAENLSAWIPLHEPGETDDAFFDRQLRLCREGDKAGNAWRRVATLHDGTIVGCFHLNSVTRGLAWEADAAWWVGAEHAGQGLATEGVRAMVAFAFEPLPVGLGLHSVHCGIEPGNEASRRVAEKCGFALKPGRRSYLKVGPRWVQHEFYLVTPDMVS